MSDSVALRHLHPGMIIVGLIKSIPRQIVGIVALLALLSKVEVARGALLVAAIIAVGIALRAAAWWRFTYAVTPDELTIESGLFNRNKRSIPWDRVQDVDIERDMFARVFGWAKVKLETGSAGKDEGSLDSIAIADAEALRDLVRARRSGALVASPSGESAAPQAPDIVFTMPARRLIQAGIFNFSLLWMAILFAIGNQIDEALPYGWKDIAAWLGLDQSRIFGLLNPVMILSGLSLFLVLGFLSGIVQMVVTNFGFRLGVDGAGLRRVRGLFTRSEVVIPRKRIQLAIVSRGWLSRRFGFARVAVQTLGMADRTSRGAQDLAPLAEGEETRQLLDLAGHFAEPDAGDFQPVSPAHTIIGVAAITLLPLAIITVNGLFRPQFLWLLLLVPLLGGFAWVSRRCHAWVASGGILAIRRGWFVEKRVLIPLDNIQSSTLERGPLQRRLGLASLIFDTAGGPATGWRIANINKDHAAQLLRDLRADAPSRKQVIA